MLSTLTCDPPGMCTSNNEGWMNTIVCSSNIKNFSHSIYTKSRGGCKKACPNGKKPDKEQLDTATASAKPHTLQPFPSRNGRRAVDSIVEIVSQGHLWP